MENEQENKAPSANRQIAKAAGTVMIAMVLSQVAGLLAKSLIASTFGTSYDSEAYFAANRFAEIIFNLMAGGALGSAFIPTFTGLLTNKKTPDAWKLASAIGNLIFLVLTLTAILSWIFARPIVHYILAPGFAVNDPAIETLTIELLRIQLPSAIIFGLSGLIMGILNAHQHFLVPALAPSMYQLGQIFGTLVLSRHMGIQGLAWGVVLGSALHLLLQIPSLLRLPKWKYTPSLGLKSASVREVGWLMAPRLLGVAVVQLNFLLNTNLASMQSEGSLTAINLAFPLMIMPQAAIAQSIATASLPTFSAQVAQNRLQDMRSSLASTLRGVLLLAIPATVGLLLLRRPLVIMVYQRNAFDEVSTNFVVWALVWYAAGLVGHCIVEIISRAFYALHDTKTPVLIGIAAMSLNLALSLLFSYLFTLIGWMPHGGLALANSLATALESVGLLYLMRRKLKGLEGAIVWQGVLKAVIASAAMAAGLLLWLRFSPFTSSILITLGGVAGGGLLYIGALWLQKTQELQSVLNFALGFIKRRLKK